jgi:hypothetical protein
LPDVTVLLNVLLIYRYIFLCFAVSCFVSWNEKKKYSSICTYFSQDVTCLANDSDLPQADVLVNDINSSHCDHDYQIKCIILLFMF